VSWSRISRPFARTAASATRRVIGRNVAVENRTSIGARCKIETNAYITAITTIGDDCFIAPEVTFTNDDFLGRSEKRFEHHGGPILETGARVGANSAVLPGRRIARDGLVAQAPW
jgi:UDP-2-acetamido-3-amino-2,3-dideoxy-glucuronate N-acetyltransferase